MRTAAKPRQSPCVGRGDSNWQGQAKSQLQLLTSTPSMYQSTCAMVSSFRATTRPISSYPCARSNRPRAERASSPWPDGRRTTSRPHKCGFATQDNCAGLERPLRVVLFHSPTTEIGQKQPLLSHGPLQTVVMRPRQRDLFECCSAHRSVYRTNEPLPWPVTSWTQRSGSKNPPDSCTVKRPPKAPHCPKFRTNKTAREAFDGFGQAAARVEP